MVVEMISSRTEFDMSSGLVRLQLDNSLVWSVFKIKLISKMNSLPSFLSGPKLGKHSKQDHGVSPTKLIIMSVNRYLTWAASGKIKTESEKFIQKFFRNFSFTGHDPAIKF